MHQLKLCKESEKEDEIDDWINMLYVISLPCAINGNVTVV